MKMTYHFFFLINYCPCVADFIFSIQGYKRTLSTALGKICMRNYL